MEDPHLPLAQSITQAVVGEVMNAITSLGGWVSFGTKDGLEGFSIPRDGPQIVKVVGHIDRPAHVVRDYFWDVTNKKKWDETNKHTNIVKTFTPHLRIVHEETNAPWPVSNRDVVVAQCCVERDDGFLIAQKSIDGVVPEASGVVRAESLLFGMLLQRETDSRTRFTLIGSLDPKGSIPNMVVKKMIKKQLDKMVAFKKAL